MADTNGLPEARALAEKLPEARALAERMQILLALHTNKVKWGIAKAFLEGTRYTFWFQATYKDEVLGTRGCCIDTMSLSSRSLEDQMRVEAYLIILGFRQILVREFSRNVSDLVDEIYARESQGKPYVD